MSVSDKLREEAKMYRFYADGDPRDALTQRNLALADALDLLADAWEVLDDEPRCDERCAPEFARIACRCQEYDNLTKRIERFADGAK